MVGAINSFIRKPFLWRSFKFGIYGSLLSNAFMLGAIYSFRKELEGIVSISDYLDLGIVFSLVIVLGIVISLASTYIAVNKFLMMKFDEMFY